jgi:hypothetical protein
MEGAQCAKGRKTMVYKSRFTPGLENGSDVSFNIGETVTYRMRDGKTVKITVDSEIKTHDQAPGDKTGYESIFSDTGERSFAVRQGIADWEGKVNV